jgi:hypothetical protein
MSVHANQIAVLWQSMSMRRQPTSRREFFIQPKVSPHHLLWNFSQKSRRLFREHDKSSRARFGQWRNPRPSGFKVRAATEGPRGTSPADSRNSKFEERADHAAVRTRTDGQRHHPDHSERRYASGLTADRLGYHAGCDRRGALSKVDTSRLAPITDAFTYLAPIAGIRQVAATGFNYKKHIEDSK